jgi:glutathione synthase/RimK-type ligase-like ATP-grasp enzyme
MNLIIHHQKNSFSEPWIKYCEENGIPHKVVNCFDNNIMQQIEKNDALMWHHNHANYMDIQLSKPLLFSLEQSGVKIFPNFNTNWHFDNKLAQKYLLEAIDAPLVTSYVFYTKKEALNWVEKTIYPKVFKLKGGAGAQNVKLAKDQKAAVNLVNKSFGKGWPAFDKAHYFKERLNNFLQGRESFIAIAKAFGRLVIPIKDIAYMPVDKGYVYFQDFIDNNDHDIRVIVIGDKSFAIKRMVRANDFRASGSGSIVYEKNAIDERCLKIAFETTKKLNAQCLAYDFVFDVNNNPLIVEISYCFTMQVYVDCPGYWDDSLVWHNGDFNPYGWMIEGLLGMK